MAILFGMMRIKNEARWIERVIHSIQPACEHIFVFDDHSTDGTPEICKRMEKVSVYPSPFIGLDEARDKNWLLQRIYEAIPEAGRHFTRGNPNSPYWALAIDGDEELMQGDVATLRDACTVPLMYVYAFRILYLWDTPDHVRIDGVYGQFNRPSLFRLMNSAFTYKQTPWGNGANFHCSQIPQEMLHHRQQLPVRLLHWGYIGVEDRARKWVWYNTIDPHNPVEDEYRHVIQGDVPEVPANMRLKWAGPLQVVPLGSIA